MTRMKRGGTRKKRGGTRKKRGGTRKKRGGMLKALQTTIVPYGLYKLNKYYQNKTRRNKRKSYRGGKQSLINLRIKRINEKRKRAKSIPVTKKEYKDLTSIQSPPGLALKNIPPGMSLQEKKTRKRAKSIPVTKKEYKDLIDLGIGSRISNAIARSNDVEFAAQVAREFQNIQSEKLADEIGIDPNTLQCETKWDQKYPCSEPPPPPPPLDGGRKTRKRRRTRRKRRKKRTKRKRRKTKIRQIRKK